MQRHARGLRPQSHFKSGLHSKNANISFLLLVWEELIVSLRAKGKEKGKES